VAVNLIQITDILLAALLVEVQKDSTVKVCTITKQPGDSITVDAQCDAMIWLRLVDSTPTVGQTTNMANQCYWGLTHQIELGVVRQSPMPSEVLNTVELPSDEEITAATDAQYRDMAAMRRAIQAAQREIEDLVPGAYAPMGPLAGVIGGTWALSVEEQ
jgi:hypothetical protein